MTEQSAQGQRITAERHIAIGARLDEIQRELSDIAVELEQARPQVPMGVSARGVKSGLNKGGFALHAASESVRKAARFVSESAQGEHPGTFCGHWYRPIDLDKYGPLPHDCKPKPYGQSAEQG